MKSLKLSLISFNAMGLLSFDTLHGFFLSRNFIARINKLGELLKKENADIVALQEVHTYPVFNILRKKLSTVYPYIAYKPFFYGPRGGIVIFSKLELEDVTYIDFEKRGSMINVSIVAHIIRNGILSCKIKNTPIHILNTHLTPNMDHDWSEKNRYNVFIQAQLNQAVEVIKKLSAQKTSILLAGDFNTPKDTYLYRGFIQSSFVKDIFEKFTFATQHQEYLPKNVPTNRLDYIFILDKFSKATITSAKHLFQEKVPLKKNKIQYISDHIALKTEIVFQTEKR